jgi:hypothetical protein
MPTLAEAPFFFKRGCRVWRGGPTSPLDGIGEELDSLLYVFSSFEGDVEG